MRNKRIVVIGGGHGQAAICRGIKNIGQIDISAIVTVADDGGSTGRLRREFHIPAMGDIRNVMTALVENETLMTDMMNYRFADPEGKEEGIAGHNLGNLILTALTEEYGSFLDAVKMVQKFLNVKGRIIPATTQVIELYALMEDGVIVRGEANIPSHSNHICRVFYDEPVKATEEAVRAINEADLIIYGIGSVYTSILPNIIIPEISHALNQAKGKKIYFCNAMTQPGETDGYCVEDHVQALMDHGAPVDAVIYAKDPIPENVIERYREKNSTPVSIRDQEHDYLILPMSMLDFDGGLVRHDSGKIEEAVMKLIKAV